MGNMLLLIQELSIMAYALVPAHEDSKVIQLMKLQTLFNPRPQSHELAEFFKNQIISNRISAF